MPLTIADFTVFVRSFTWYYFYAGVDWKWGDQDGGAGSVGVVMKIDERKTIIVS